MRKQNGPDGQGETSATCGSKSAVERLVMRPCPGDLDEGEYVFASKWPDADWNDGWAVGFVGVRGENYIQLTGEDGSMLPGVGVRGFRYFRRITAEQGARIIAEYRPREGTVFDEQVRDNIFTA